MKEHNILQRNNRHQSTRTAVWDKSHTFPQSGNITEWNKRSQRRKHCTLAVVRRSQKFSPRRRGGGWPKFNHLEMVTTFTYRPSLVKIDAHNFELSW